MHASDSPSADSARLRAIRPETKGKGSESKSADDIQ